jgi:2-methylcitrate dehydratase
MWGRSNCIAANILESVMNKPLEQLNIAGEARALDSIQERLTEYACGLEFETLSPEAVHAAKVRVIDTLGALMGGFFGEACGITRNMAARLPDPAGATVIGTRIQTSPDMAAFANATTARFVEMNDVHHWPGSRGGHPSDVVMPILAAAEYAKASGRDFLTAIVLGYEFYLRLADNIQEPGFDCSTFACIGTTAAAAKLMGLSRDQMAHAIAMAAVPNNILKQVRTGHLSMWKAVAAGQAGRAGVFSAMMAAEGMEGPHLPFEGKHGWCNHVSGPFELPVMGDKSTQFRICDTLIKQRSSCATTISSILAAEKASPGTRDKLEAVKQVTVEVYDTAKRNMGTGEHHWNPQSRETADHSIPYVVAAALMDGTVTPRQFDDAHIRSPQLRALLPKIEVVENPEFSEAYHRVPVVHHTRVTVEMADGERIVGESGGPKGDLSNPKSDAEIEAKFSGMTVEYLGTARTEALLERLWQIDQMDNVADLPPALLFA